MSDDAPSDGGLIEEFIDDYFAECDEHLSAVRSNLLAMEASVGRPVADRPLIEALLRSFHSIKGLSGMVGVQRAERLAHQIETALRPLRDNAVLTADWFAALASAAELMEKVIRARRERSAPPNIQPMLDQLAALADRSLTSAPAAPAQRAAGLALPSLEASESARLAAALERGSQAWHFEFTPSAQLAERGINVNVVRKRLEDIGAVIRATPRVVEGSRVVFEFLVAAPALEQLFASWLADGITFAPYLPVLSGQPRPTAPVDPAEAPPLPDAAWPEQGTVAAPATIVRVDLARLDDLMQRVGELVITRARLANQLAPLESRIPAGQWRQLQETGLVLERQLRYLREAAMRVRLVPIGEVFTRMQFVVHELARSQGKLIQFSMSGQQTEIDKLVVERMLDPLLHLVRNAVSHGIETPDERAAVGKPRAGNIRLRAGTAGDLVTIEVEDDGRGINLTTVAERGHAAGLLRPGEELDPSQLLDVLCAPGFSTRSEADLASGRGVGMAVAREAVLELAGSLALTTTAGQGTCFTIQLPLTLAILDALILSTGRQTFAMPQLALREILETPPGSLKPVGSGYVMRYREGALPVVSLARLFGLRGSDDVKYVLVLHNALLSGGMQQPVGIGVERVRGLREIVVRAINDPLIQVPGISGATELGDGLPILILDPAALLRIATQDDGQKPI